MEELDYVDYHKEEGIRERRKLNKHFVEHPSNKRLAKHIFYTKDKSPETTTNEIIQTLNLTK